MAMATTTDSTAATFSRQARQIAKGLSSTWSGRERGPDREVRRNSYDVDHDKARPWRRIGDGSVAQGLATMDALLKTARDRRTQEYVERRRERQHPVQLCPAMRKRVLREESSCRMCAADGEIAPSTIVDRIVSRADGGGDERGNHQGLCGSCHKRKNTPLQRTDVTVLEALASLVNFVTGHLYPTYEEIAERAGCSRRAVAYALFRLQLRGLLDRVRRSVRIDGTRKQTSNAYTLANRARMAKRTATHYAQLLAKKLRKLTGGAPAALVDDPPAVPARGPMPAELADILSRICAHASKPEPSA